MVELPSEGGDHLASKEGVSLARQAYQRLCAALQLDVTRIFLERVQAWRVGARGKLT